MSKSPDAFRTISEAAKKLDLPQHVLRHWEDVFGHIRPMRRAGGRRYYRNQDIELLQGVRTLLYDERYTTKGVQKIFKENGPQHVASIGRRALNGEANPADVPAEEKADKAPLTVSPKSLAAKPATPEPVTTLVTKMPEKGIGSDTKQELVALLSRLENVQDRLDEVIVTTRHIGG